MRKLLTFAAALATAAFAWAGGPPTPSQKKVVAKKAATVAVAAKTPAKPAAAKPSSARKPLAGAATTAAARRTVKKAPVARNTTTWRNRQTSPSADRYREIQDALVEKGYLPAEEATGTWNTSSAEALKKFQADQTLESTGKINSLSLIALGLGPHHDTTVPKLVLVDGNFVQEEAGR